jgi:ketosteroid isomerase-like protein
VAHYSIKTMKKSLFIFAVLLSLFTNAQQIEKQKIINVLTTQREAWNRGNIDEYMQGYWQSDSLVFIGKSGINKGWNLTLLNYKNSYPDKATMGTLKFDIISVEMFSKTTAHVVGKWTLKRVKKESSSGHFTLVFKKINNRWLIVSDHTS